MKSAIEVSTQMKVFLMTVAVLISTVQCKRIATEEGWPGYRHDSKRTGVTSETVPSELTLNWTYNPVHPPAPVWSMPAEEMPRMHFDNTYHVSAVNGLAYFGSSVDNKVYALDIETGEERWTYYSDGPVRFSPTFWNSRIYFGSDDGYVYCLKAKSGKLAWKFHVGPRDKKIIGSGRMVSLFPVRTSVLVDEGIVYFGAGVFPYDGLYVCALDARKGSVVWKNDDLDDDVFDLRYGGVSPQSYLIASEDHLFVPSGRAMPAVFDKADGSFLNYLAPSGKQGGTWGMIDQGKLVAGVDRSGTPVKVSFDPETGENKGDLFASFTGLDMVGSGNVSYVVTAGGIYAIDRLIYPVIQQKIDSITEIQNRVTTAFRRSIYDAGLTGGTGFEQKLEEITGRLNALAEEVEELKTSSSLWFYPEENLGSIIITGDQVIAGGDGLVLGLNKKTGEALWQGEVDGVASGLAVSDHSLIVSTDRGPIYCFSGDSEKVKEDDREGIPGTQSGSPYPENKMTTVYQEAASAILNETGIDKGYCLVLECGDGQLAYELAKRSDIHIIGLEENPRKVKEAKRRLDEAGLYGSRVVVENWSIASLPDYFADLIVSDEILNQGRTSHTAVELFRILKPGGGIACFGQPAVENYSPGPLDEEELESEWVSLEIEDPETSQENGNWILFTRKNLAGAGGWTHQYGDPANTSCSDDKLVMAPFTTLWYGSPGPQLIPDRHARAVSPVAFDGKLIVEGENVIMAYNAYNGTKLWERWIEGANRMRVDADGGNMAINHNGLFVAVKEKCLQLDMETGETIQTFSLPPEWKGKPRRWGYIAVKDNILLGSVAMPLKQEYAHFMNNYINQEADLNESEETTPMDALMKAYYEFSLPDNEQEIEQAFQRDGTKWRSVTDFPDWNPGTKGLNNSSELMMASDGIFAIDLSDGTLRWTHQGNKIAQITISVGESDLYFAEKQINGSQKQKGLTEKKKYLQEGKWESFDIELGPDESDVRMVHSLDLLSGQEKWKRAIDLSGCGDDMAASGYHNDVLLFFGSYGLHDKGRFPDGQLKWHRVTAVSALDGEMMWSRPLNYMVRPLIIKDEVIIEPRKCDLYTGEIKTRTHPVTGKEVPWEFYRPGHTCAATAGNENCLFYRSYNAAYYDLKEDKGLSYYGAIRPGCWINLIPGNGLVLFPEASSGCTCSFPLRTSVVLKPEKKEKIEDWSLYISHAPMTPVQHLAVNMGAPGDKKDNNGTLWFGYPRPETPTGVKFDIHETILEGMGFYSYDSKGVEIEGADNPWLYTNGCFGLRKCEIPLINSSFGEEAGVYTVRLGFASPSTRRSFDIQIQDQLVMENLDILKEAGGVNKAVIKEFKGIAVEENLSVELIPAVSDPDMEQSPVINFIEVIREDTPAQPEPSEAVKVIYLTEAKKLLQEAEKARGMKKYEDALTKYHRVLEGGTAKEIKLKALEGMESIAHEKSLPVIKKYCQNLDPIMWDYKEPDQEVVEAADKVYMAILKKE